MVQPHSHTDITTRAVVVGLKVGGKPASEISQLLGISSRHVSRIYAKAIERGFDPSQRPLLLRDEYFKDAPRSGRPKKHTAELEQTVAAMMCRDDDGHGQEKTCADLADELSREGYSVSSSTIWRVLKKGGHQKTKPTRKPGPKKKKDNTMVGGTVDQGLEPPASKGPPPMYFCSDLGQADKTLEMLTYS